MKTLIALTSVAIALLGSSVEAASCSSVYGQCGGVNWTGPTCCASGSTCVSQPGNIYYSQCLPSSQVVTTKAPTTTTTKKTTTTTKTPVTTKAPTTTKATTTTTKKATTTKAPSSTNTGYSVVPGGVSGSSVITRYWDCCKSSCSWPGKASVTSPIDTCGKNGISLVDDNATSGCETGGTGYVCNNNQPWAINDNLAYGFAAASIQGSNEARLCCACMELTFTSTAVAGKKMVVQLTNTGDDPGTDVGNHFDLQIPGGGVGQFNGCASQWGASTDGWGARYGGVSSLAECSQLPSALQPGCKWRFGWYMGADNPSMTFKEVTCPPELIARTGCQRN